MTGITGVIITSAMLVFTGMGFYFYTTNQLSLTLVLVALVIIASSFGMIDSLGKNLTIRTWDGGKKWWTCFYDMDTALGLSNEGAENIPEMQKKAKFVRISSSGIKESHPHDLLITNESPNYHSFD